MEKVFVFVCKSNRKLYAFTLDKDGKNLPFCDSTITLIDVEFSTGDEWELYLAIDFNEELLLNEKGKKVMEGIAKDGYFLNEVEITFNESTEPVETLKVKLSPEEMEMLMKFRNKKLNTNDSRRIKFFK